MARQKGRTVGSAIGLPPADADVDVDVDVLFVDDVAAAAPVAVRALFNARRGRSTVVAVEGDITGAAWSRVLSRALHVRPARAEVNVG